MVDRHKAYLLFLVLFLLVGGFLSIQIGNWGHFTYRPGSEYSDLTITFWPNIVYIQNSLASFHQLPLWRTLIFSGSPFDSDPQSGLWYPPNLIFLLTPATLGFNLLVLAHLVAVGVGAWLWARAEGLSWQGSALAAASCAFAPRLYAHLGFGHMGLVYGATYVPWALWASQGIGTGERRRIPTLGLVLGMQLIANPQVFFYTALLCAIYALFIAWRSRRGKPKGERLIAPLGLAVAILLAALVSAAQLLPMLRFAPLSGRSAMGVADSAISSLPLRYLWGVFVADHHGYMEYMTYFGVVALILALFTLPNRRFAFFWVCLTAAGVYAFGTRTPLYGWLYSLLPVLGWLRSPARVFLVVAPLISLLAGAGFDVLFRLPRGRLLGLASVAAFALGSFALALGVGYAVLYGTPPLNLIAFGALAPLTAGLCLYCLARPRKRDLAFALFACLMMLDLFIVDGTFIEGRPAAQLLAESPLISFLTERNVGGDFRVYSPSYSLPRYLGAWYGLESADGVDPLYLAEYDRFMQAASGVKRSHYEVTIPAMEGEAPAASVNRDAAPQPRLLGLLNVRYVAAEFPIDVKGLRLIDRFANTYLYENAYDRGRVYFSTNVLPVKDLQAALAALERMGDQPQGGYSVVEGSRLLQGSDGAAEITLIRATPNRLEVSAETQSEGLLVVSQAWHPDWQAYLDGKRVQVWKADGVLSGVYLPAGKHAVVLAYRPWLTALGVCLSLLGAGLSCYLLFHWRVSTSPAEISATVGAASSNA
ncbi:MAG: YfhO family protein [Anaerolineales bacterium]|nr:YfhO family protein [Anaerolineales bacterium]